MGTAHHRLTVWVPHSSRQRKVGDGMSRVGSFVPHPLLRNGWGTRHRDCAFAHHTGSELPVAPHLSDYAFTQCRNSPFFL